ncbi:MAG: UDP-N-acetylmuramoyl-L-alanine--D-glutamate ligase [Clostridia bacterium]|nr:UDP-N-acetylmuramoyl-L-alanine--D-glutamate ligase [Clostridia bacterium]
MNLLGKNVVVYGGGISGLSAYELAKEKGARVMIYDDNDRPHTTSSSGVFARADVIVLSPGIASGNPHVLDARLEGKLVIGEIELASQFCQGEQIAVTGTNGKTTTVKLIDHILKSAHINSYAVGNIGVAFSSICDRLDALDTAVVEVSSFQLESVKSFSPDIAVLLNIKPDHLERHETLDRYISAKSNIFMHQCECDVVVYNADDENIAGLVPFMKAKKVPFSMSKPVDGAYLSSGFICYKGMPIVEAEDVDAKGVELENVLAAVAVTMSKGISRYTIASALCSFSRPQFRRTKIAELHGVKIYNDSKATNIASTLSAISAMNGDTVLLLGGAKRMEDFDELFSVLDKRVVGVVVFGENRNEIAFSADRYNIHVEVFDTIENGVDRAFELAKALCAENLLFSPASKSFDRFSNYEERGRYFDKLVKAFK